MRDRMFLRVVSRSLRRRWRAVLVAVIAVTIGAALGAAAAGVAWGLEEKTSLSLRAYGANLLVLPRSGVGTGATIDENDLAALERGDVRGALVGYAPFLFAVTEVETRPVALAGTWFDALRTVSPWWRVEGAWIRERDDRARVLIGVRVAAALGLGPGDQLTLRYRGASRTYRVAGVVTTGGPEDGQVFLTLSAAQELAGQQGRVSLVQVSARPAGRGLEALAAELQASLPDARVKTVRQVALAEQAVASRVGLLLGSIGLAVLLAAGLGVMATMSTAVLERRREIGLMKALGATGRRIGGLLLAEAVAIGVVGGVVGYAAGLVLLQAVGRAAFGSAVVAPAWVGPATVAAAVAVSVLASLLPVRRAAAMRPALVLAGG